MLLEISQIIPIRGSSVYFLKFELLGALSFITGVSRMFLGVFPYN